jgi:hypothetical protein
VNAKAAAQSHHSVFAFSPYETSVEVARDFITNNQSANGWRHNRRDVFSAKVPSDFLAKL